MSCMEVPEYWMKGCLDDNSARIVAMYLLMRFNRFSDVLQLFCAPDASFTETEMRDYVASFCSNMFSDLRDPESLCYGLNLMYHDELSFYPEFFDPSFSLHGVGRDA